MLNRFEVGFRVSKRLVKIICMKSVQRRSFKSNYSCRTIKAKVGYSNQEHFPFYFLQMWMVVADGLLRE